MASTVPSTQQGFNRYLLITVLVASFEHRYYCSCVWWHVSGLLFLILTSQHKPVTWVFVPRGRTPLPPLSVHWQRDVREGRLSKDSADLDLLLCHQPAMRCQAIYTSLCPSHSLSLNWEHRALPCGSHRFFLYCGRVENEPCENWACCG